MRLEQIRRLTLSGDSDREKLGQTLELQRSWPVDANHLLLEYRSETGMLLPGQWSREPGELERQAMAMGSRSALRPMLATSNGQRVLLQPRGLDARLRGLTALLRSERCQLLSHRPGKRAIVRWQGPAGPLYVKQFASSRAFARGAQSFDHAHRSAGSFRTPEIQRRLPRLRALMLSAVEGTSLHERLQSSAFQAGVGRQIGSALRALQAVPAAPHLSPHRGEDEARLIQGWMPHVAAFLPEWFARMRQHCDAISARLCDSNVAVGMAHRDLHDKQILISAEQPPGLIDFDTMAMADPALDPANLLAHLELRQLQGLCSPAVRLSTGEAVLQGYGTSPQPSQLQTYLDAARLRLACVYGFRPRWQSLIAPMLTRIGRPWEDELSGDAEP